MAIPVKVRGICVFGYTDTAPTVDGVSGGGRFGDGR